MCIGQIAGSGMAEAFLQRAMRLRSIHERDFFREYTEATRALRHADETRWPHRSLPPTLPVVVGCPRRSPSPAHGQRETIERYARSAGFEPVGKCRDEGASGTKDLDDREGLRSRFSQRRPSPSCDGGIQNLRRFTD